MKITLSEPPEGFEAEARIAHIANTTPGDRYLRTDRSVGTIIGGTEYFGALFIILMPNKKQFWRLDPVATFEEATVFLGGRRYGMWVDGDIGAFTKCNVTCVKHWMRFTECSE
jgi:hypothetical protein